MQTVAQESVDTFPQPATTRESSHRLRVAYIMSRFPKITETFVLREMIEVEKLGVEVEVFPLQRERTSLVQPDAKPYVDRAHFTPFLSLAIVWANLVTLLLRPWRYLTTLAILFRANFGCLRYLVGAFAFFPKAVYFARRMKELEIQHVHAHFASHPAAVAFVIHRFADITYSFTAHGSDLHRDQHMLREKTASAAFVAAISQYNRDMIVDHCCGEHTEKVIVVHCGVDPNRFPTRNTPTPFDQSNGSFKIVCIGTLHEVKGQTFLIDACRILDERGIDFACHLIGGGPDESMLREQALQCVPQAMPMSDVRIGKNTGRASGTPANRVVFHGGCTSAEVREQLADADVVVVPSVLSRDGRREGIPVVLMEAMASGVPCVASRISGIPEIVEDGFTGLLTTPGDATEIADALERLANDDSLRHQLANASVDRVLRDFHLSKNAALLAEHFSESIKS